LFPQVRRRSALSDALLVAFVALAAVFIDTATVRADSPGTVSVNLVPLNAQHRGIALRAQTVEATLYEDSAGVWADTDVWYRLHNPDSKPITVTVALPGPQAMPAELVKGIELRLGEEPVALLEGKDSDGVSPILWTRLPLLPRRSVDLRLSYRQALPERNDMVIFAYMSTAARQWARAPEGVKLKIRFRTPVKPESILALAPPPGESDNGSMTWQWAGEKNLTNVGLAMMMPSWWDAFETERQAATSPQATMADYVALARRYQQLAQLPLLPFQNADFFDRFYPSAVSTLESSVADPALASSPESVPVFAALTTLYDARAARADGTGRYMYAQLAADAALRGVAAGHADPEMHGRAVEVVEKALALADTRDDVEAARELRAQLEALRLGANGLTADDREQAELRDKIGLLLQRKEYGDARRLLSDHFSGALAVRDLPAPPLISSLLITVTTKPGHRQFWVTASDGQESGSAHELLEAARASLAPGNSRYVGVTGDGLELDIPFSDSAELQQTQARLAASLPELPELALFRDVLLPSQLLWTAGVEPFRVVESYNEIVSLAPSDALWAANADRLETTAEEIAAADQKTSAETGDVNSLISALMQHDAAAWRQFSESGGVQYDVVMSDEAPTHRRWSAKPGDRLELRATVRRWRNDQLKLGLAGAVSGAIVLAGAATGTILLIAHGARRFRRRQA
jgi:hypothetical protein